MTRLFLQDHALEDDDVDTPPPLTLQEVADRIDPRAAQLAVAKVFAALGAAMDWSSDHLDYVAEAVSPATPADVASWSNQTAAETEWWENVA